VWLMLPNKVVIAGTGLLVTAGLRAVYRTAAGPEQTRPWLAALIAVSSVAGALLWSAAMALVLGTNVRDQLVHVGFLGSGVPMLSGMAYHAVILVVWSLGYVGFTRRPLNPAREAPAPVTASRDVVLRDGRRTHVIAVDDIDWIRADGDYVRVHMGDRSLLVRDTMGRLEATLGHGLVRVHRSTIVNLARVKESVALPNRDVELILRNGVRLRASRTYADRLRDRLSPHVRSS
jgi:hypothetical protein